MPGRGGPDYDVGLGRRQAMKRRTAAQSPSAMAIRTDRTEAGTGLVPR